MRLWCCGTSAVLLLLGCHEIYGQTVIERLGGFVRRRHDERHSAKPDATHDYYGPTYPSPYSGFYNRYSSDSKKTSPGSSFQPSYLSQSASREGSSNRPSGSIRGNRPSNSAAGRITEAQRQARKVILAGNEFGLNLMRYLISKNDNTIMAPVSLSIALGMLYFAAAGNTKKELARTLHYDEFGLNQENLKAPLRAISEGRKAVNQKGFSFQLGNFLFTQKDQNVSESYKKDISELFASSVETVDFSKPDSAINRMNQLITEATHGQIMNPIEGIGPDTRLVLMNAVYFKGFWKQPFSVRSSFNSTFLNDGVDEVGVTMMYMRNTFPVKYLRDIDADAIQLPYEGDMTVMLILLPKNPQGVNQMLQKLNVGQLLDDLKTYQNESLDLHIPRFSVQGNYRFKYQLYDLGIRDLFTPGAANLPEVDPEGRVVLDDVIHEAKIKVDERGTEAVALTTAPIINYSRYPSFNVRHPFVFFIVHKPTGSIFFAGKILRMNEAASSATG